MSAINFSYKADLTYTEVIDNIIILRKKEDNEVICKFPIPKKFHISGHSNGDGDKNIYSYIITPYKLNKPRFIPKGYKNLRLDWNGLWCMDKVNSGSRSGNQIYYIDTTILSEKHFEYPTDGKFKIREDEIPSPFWVRGIYADFWKKLSEVQKVVKKFDENARLIHEEEMISIFALNSLGMEFVEYISDSVNDYLNSRSNLKYFCIEPMLCLCLDNWDMIVASKEDRNLYKFIVHDLYRSSHNGELWYRNRSYVHIESDETLAIHAYPVLEDRNKGENELRQQTSGNEWKDKLRQQTSGNEWKDKLRQQTSGNEWKDKLRQQTSGNEWKDKLRQQTSGSEWKNELIQQTNGSKKNGLDVMDELDGIDDDFGIE